MVLLAIVALVVGFGTFKVNRAIGGNPFTWINTIKNPRGKFPGKGDRINILLVGKDYSYVWTHRNVALNGARYSTESRSDSIMVVSLDMASGRVSALSIPRDTWLTAPDGETGKINGTYRRGGPKLLEQTLGQVLGVVPDYYIAVKPDALKAVVDKLGGVNVQTIDAMEYNDAAAGLHIQLPVGPQEINGDQAIGFARFREPDVYERQANGQPIWTHEKDSEGNPIFVRRQHITHSKEEGDPRRMARQQQLIRAIVTKAKAPANWLHLDSTVNTMFDQVETDLHKDQFLALAALFRSLQPDQMQSGTLEGRGLKKGHTWCFILDDRKKEAMVDWLLKGDETAANRLTVVAVQNGTDIRGAARRIADQLVQDGFDAHPDSTPVTVADIAEPSPTASPTTGTTSSATPAADVTTTRVVYARAAVAMRAQKIAQLLGVPADQVVKDTRPDTAGSLRQPDAPDITVIVGRDLAAAGQMRSARL